MRLRSFIVVSVLCWATGVAAQGVKDPKAPAKDGPQIGSLSVTTAGKNVVGTAFFVTKQGHIATSFSNVRHAKTAVFLLPQGVTLKVTGAVAVNKSRDLVILATSSAEIIPKIPYALDAPKLHAILLPHSGSLSNPLDKMLPKTPAGVMYLPRLQGFIRGSEYLAGFAKIPESVRTIDPAADLWITDVGFDPTYVGAPVWGETRTSIVGIVSGFSDGSAGNRVILPIKYVQELIPQEEQPPLIPLADLSKWEDPFVLPALPAQAARPGQNLAQQYEKAALLSEEIDGVLRELQEFEKQLLAEQLRLKELIQQTQSQYRLATLPRSSSKSGKDDKKSSSKSRREDEADDRARSDLVRALQQTIATSADALYVTEIHLRFLRANMLNHTQRREYEAKIAQFLATDPFELGDPADLIAVQAQLQAEQLRRPANPLNDLLLGICAARQKNLPAMQANLREMLRKDAGFAPLKTALELRWANQLNKTKTPLPAQSLKHPVVAVILPLLEARMLCDAGEHPAAIQILEQWCDIHPNHPAVRNFMCWKLLALTPPKPTHNQRALVHAQHAVRFQEGKGWQSLAALAAAQQRAGQAEQTKKTFAQLCDLAPDAQAALIEEWKTALSNDKPILWPR